MFYHQRMKNRLSPCTFTLGSYYSNPQDCVYNLLPLILSLDIMSLSHWYLRSGVVLDCIDSWSLHPCLLWFSELFCLCCVAALKILPALLLNALIIPILRIGVQSPYIIPVPGYPVTFPLVLSCHFPIGILCQAWYLIVSIPDICTLTYLSNNILFDLSHQYVCALLKRTKCS